MRVLESVSACAVYRLFDETGGLLYVGIGYEPRWRVERHLRKPWGTDVTRVDVRWYASREAAISAERTAIVNEHPVHNVQRYAEWAASLS